MNFRQYDGDKDKFDESLHYRFPLKFDKSLHYIAPLRTPILPEQKYYETKHLECKSLEFNGSDSYVDCGNDPSLGDGTHVFSVFCKVKPLSDNVFVGNLLDNANGWGLEVRSNKISVGFKRSAPAEYWLGYGNDTINFNGEFNLCFVYPNDGTYPKMWVNGNSQTVTRLIGAGAAEALSGFTTNNNDTHVGGKFQFFAGATQYYKGSISEVLIYNRELNSTEVLNLSLNKSVDSTGLVLDLPFISDYNSKTIIKDKSGNDNNGTLHNCSWNCDWIREKHKVI